jgi:SAM-dependent methyltransferase
MQLNYNYLKNKYLNYFEGNKESCNLILTDVIFGFNEISEIIKKDNITSVLEIGSGTGILLNELQNIFPNIKFKGVDPNESGFHNYKKIFDKIKIDYNKLEVVNKSLDSFSTNEKFDFIFSINVFEHVTDQFRYIDKTLDLLNKNGKNIIICPNYDFPYEPHFVLPIIINKKITHFLFKSIIKKHEIKTKEFGLWSELNLTGKKIIEKYLRKNNINYNLDYSIKERMLNRASVDKIFKKRQGIAATLAVLSKFFFIDKIMFSILKIPFPYMKLIIKK